MGSILKQLPPIDDPRVLVGYNTADDAGVVKLTDEIALIQTVDIFTPVVDDPYTYGQIAAANSISDVYAMGGTPVCAMNIMGFPQGKFDLQVMADILQGAYDKAKEAGISIVGGHTIKDDEMKYGLSVSGIIHPDNIMTNASAKAGDIIFITKPLGSGVISTGVRAGKFTDEDAAECIRWMSKLNRAASEAAIAAGSTSITDVTGFGMLGHLWEMAEGSGLQAVVYSDKVPFMDLTFKAIELGTVPGGSHNNKAYLVDKTTYADSVTQTVRIALCDAQTSGGLIIAIPKGNVQKFLDEMDRRGEADCAHQIGVMKAENPGTIEVL